MIFSKIPNIKFSIVFTSYKCVRLHIMTRYKLFEFFVDKNEFIFLLEPFC
jgi:hypothetical protein